MKNEVKEPALKYNYTTAEGYLEIDRASQEKYELHQGTLITMTGASLKHNQVQGYNYLKRKALRLQQLLTKM